MKTQRSISMELRRIEHRLREDKRKLSPCDHDMLFGAMQALSWAMGQNAARPMRCLSTEYEKPSPAPTQPEARP